MNRTHCDGPDCDHTTLADVHVSTWYTIAFDFGDISSQWPKHFCSVACIADWAISRSRPSG